MIITYANATLFRNGIMLNIGLPTFYYEFSYTLQCPDSSEEIKKNDVYTHVRTTTTKSTTTHRHSNGKFARKTRTRIDVCLCISTFVRVRVGFFGTYYVYGGIVYIYSCICINLKRQTFAMRHWYTYLA